MKKILPSVSRQGNKLTYYKSSKLASKTGRGQTDLDLDGGEGGARGEKEQVRGREARHMLPGGVGLLRAAFAGLGFCL